MIAHIRLTRDYFETRIGKSVLTIYQEKNVDINIVLISLKKMKLLFETPCICKAKSCSMFGGCWMDVIFILYFYYMLMILYGNVLIDKVLCCVAISEFVNSCKQSMIGRFGGYAPGFLIGKSCEIRATPVYFVYL